MNTSINKKYQVFTPKNIAIEMLDLIGYNDNLYGKKILENSFGDGIFLVEIVKRYLISTINIYPIDEIKRGLETDIIGIEICYDYFISVKTKLNKICEKYNIFNVNWSLYNIDFLKYDFSFNFDFIVGNPPYISYLNLDTEIRKYLRENFETCINGKPDYFYPFIEKSIKLLKDNGKFVNIVPNSIFKNNSAYELRNILLRYLTYIIDYENVDIFKNKLINTTVLKCIKGTENEYFKYYNFKNMSTKLVKKSNLSNKWIFNDNLNDNFSSNVFGNLFNVKYPVATLANDIFIIKDNYIEYEEFIIYNDFKIEKSILKRAVSIRNLSKKDKELIIFPYYFGNKNILKRYTEKEFLYKFPYAYKYLEYYKEILLKRDNHISNSWFEYGRTQALCDMKQSKVLVSNLITNNIKSYFLNEDDIPYSGLYITPKNNSDLKEALKILNSKKFLEYVNIVGNSANKGTKRISANDIKNFRF